MINYLIIYWQTNIPILVPIFQILHAHHQNLHNRYDCSRIHRIRLEILRVCPVSASESSMATTYLS